MDIIETGLEKHVQTVLIAGLRAFFATRQDYTYTQDPAKTDISILGEFGKRAVKFPTILVSHIAGDTLMRTIGSQQFREIRGPRLINDMWKPNCLCGYVRGGGHIVNAKIFIFSISAAECRILKDYINMYFSVIGRQYLQSKNVNIMDISLDQSDQVEYGNDIIERHILSVKLYTEWTETIYDVPLISAINVIGLSDI